MYKLADKLARSFALLGGAALTFLILLICASVIGRSINSILHSDFMQTSLPSLADTLLASGVGPINGDFEIVEAGMAFAIFAFLPLCQLQFAHASVDVFTSHLPERVNRVMRAIIELAFAACIVLIAVQLTSGLISKYRSGQTTLLLEFPVWWSYALSTIAAWAAALIATYVGFMRAVECYVGHAILPDTSEAIQ